jgi:hypothetical protein
MKFKVGDILIPNTKYYDDVDKIKILRVRYNQYDIQVRLTKSIHMHVAKAYIEQLYKKDIKTILLNL